jgi:hypothetical protein
VKNGPWLRGALLLFLGTGLLACGGKSTKTPAPTTGSLALTNNATATINEVYVTPVSSTVWGPIQNSAAISPGSTWTLSGLPAGSYDGKAVSIGAVGRYNAYASGLLITVGTTYPTSIVNSSFTGSLRVTNGPFSTITGLYVVPAGAASWGANQLTSTIPPSGVLVLNNLGAGAWDVRCFHADLTANAGYSIGVASLSYTNISCI